MSHPTSIQLLFELHTAPSGQFAQHANRFNVQALSSIYTRFVWKHRKMELNDSSTCLIYGQYTNAWMGDAKHLSPGFGHKPFQQRSRGNKFRALSGGSKNGNLAGKNGERLSKRDVDGEAR